MSDVKSGESAFPEGQRAAGHYLGHAATQPPPLLGRPSSNSSNSQKLQVIQPCAQLGAWSR